MTALPSAPHHSAALYYPVLTPHCRDAVFRVLAVEQPQAVVLNYAPGPLDTPMITELLADQRTDPGQTVGYSWLP